MEAFFSNDPTQLRKLAEQCFESKNWDGGIRFLTRIGESYENKSDFRSGAKVYKDCVAYARLALKDGDPSQISPTAHNCGLCLKKAGQRDQALQYFLESVQFSLSQLSSIERLLAEHRGSLSPGDQKTYLASSTTLANYALYTANSLTRMAVEDNKQAEAEKWARAGLSVGTRYPKVDSLTLQDLKGQIRDHRLKVEDPEHHASATKKQKKNQKKNQKKKAAAAAAAAGAGDDGEAGGDDEVESTAGDSKQASAGAVESKATGDASDAKSSSAGSTAAGAGAAAGAGVGGDGDEAWYQLAELKQFAVKDNERAESEAISRQLKLARAMLGLSDHRRADELLSEAVARTRKLFGAKHPRLGVALQRQAEALLATDRKQAALPILKQALEVMQPLVGEDHAELGPLLHSIAQCMPATESKEAAQLAARSLALLEKRHGKSGGALYPVCMTLATLGTLQTPLDEEAVLVYYQRALAIALQSFGDEPATERAYSQTIEFLCRTPLASSRIEAALPLLQEFDAVLRRLPRTPQRAGDLDRVNSLAAWLRAVKSGKAAMDSSSSKFAAAPSAAGGAGVEAKTAPLHACSRPGCENKEKDGGPVFNLCSQCKAVRYCSAECQKLHWKLKAAPHKNECKKA